MDIFGDISQGVGAYLAAKEASQAVQPTVQQKKIGLVLIIAGLMVTVVLIYVLVKKP